MLGQPLYMLMPEVVGFELTGSCRLGATATDMVLRVVEILRQEGVVGKFVEFFGTGMNRMSVADRATIANMAPEYGATMGFFPCRRRHPGISATDRPFASQYRSGRTLHQRTRAVPHRRRSES